LDSTELCQNKTKNKTKQNRTVTYANALTKKKKQLSQLGIFFVLFLSMSRFVVCARKKNSSVLCDDNNKQLQRTS